MTIFVANFDSDIEEYDLEEHDLKVVFENFGTVNDVYICADRKTGESLGYVFFELPFDGEAEYAIEKLDGRRWNGRRLKVNEKQEASKVLVLLSRFGYGIRSKWY
jgi:RNA recognition motif-containing protein